MIKDWVLQAKIYITSIDMSANKVKYVNYKFKWEESKW